MEYLLFKKMSLKLKEAFLLSKKIPKKARGIPSDDLPPSP
jgi:hypothetical protein